LSRAGQIDPTVAATDPRTYSDGTVGESGSVTVGHTQIRRSDRQSIPSAAFVEGEFVDRETTSADRRTERRGRGRGHKLTVLQLGDSHTAADFFTGRVRERLQEAFGDGGSAYIVPGKPHLGVRSALFDSEASEGWTYEALQTGGDDRRFYLSGFNAVSHRAGAVLSLRARGPEGYDTIDVAFLTAPGSGQAEVFVDGRLAGQINLDGQANLRKVVRAPPFGSGTGRFHDVEVRSLSDAPVAVTGFEFGRQGDGISYINLGFPGATVRLLEKLPPKNLADDLASVAPDVIVLAFGTNEGFDDSLNIGAYAAEYQEIIEKLKQLRPGVRIVIIGPPDGARHGLALRRRSSLTDSDDRSCRFPTPPKLSAVREVQRALAASIGADFWDWSSIMPARCGAQAWAVASPPLMAHDYVHMTIAGYKESADRFADFLIPSLKREWMSPRVVSNN
jgi:lysophospholipase L1-like esterase